MSHHMMDIEGAFMMDDDEALLTCVVTGPTDGDVALAKAVLARAVADREDTGTELDDDDPHAVVLSRVSLNVDNAVADLNALCQWVREALHANACAIASFHVDEEAM